MKYTEIELLASEAFKSGGFLVLNKTLLLKFGLTTTALLSNYIDKHNYFRSHTPDNDGWFYLTHAQISSQLGIGEDLVAKAKIYLKDLGIITIKRSGLPAKELIKINFSILINHLNLNESNSVPQNSEGQVPSTPQGQVTPDQGGQVTPDQGGQVTPDQGGHINININNKENIAKKIKIDKDEELIHDLNLIPEYTPIFLRWLRYKRSRGESYKNKESTFLAYKKLLKLSHADPVVATQMVDDSMANNYAGLFEPKIDTRIRTRHTDDRLTNGSILPDWAVNKRRSVHGRA
jgi:hypothetical protein